MSYILNNKITPAEEILNFADKYGKEELGKIIYKMIKEDSFTPNRAMSKEILEYKNNI